MIKTEAEPCVLLGMLLFGGLLQLICERTRTLIMIRFGSSRGLHRCSGRTTNTAWSRMDSFVRKTRLQQ